MMIEIKQINIPLFDNSNQLAGTRKELVIWNCPTCGERMGNPVEYTFIEMDEVYKVDLWENRCGHIPKSSELMHLDSKQNLRSYQWKIKQLTGTR